MKVIHMLEVCVDSLASARNAIEGGADRLELCAGLAVGGLTPYTALLRQIRQESCIPIRCLMRHRPGDFLYDSDEIRLLCDQIRELSAEGADGFVIGCLTAEGELDTEKTGWMAEACGGKGVTLHRCIDVSRDPVKTYLAAQTLGIDTVLTSGGAASCKAGTETIGRLLKLRDAHHGPEVLIGAGVNADVIRDFRKKFPNATAFHMSGKREIDSGMRYRRNGVPMGLPGLDEFHIQQTDPMAVAAARQALMA